MEVEPVNLLDGGGEEVNLNSPEKEEEQEESKSAANIDTKHVDPEPQKPVFATSSKGKHHVPKEEVCASLYTHSRVPPILLRLT